MKNLPRTRLEGLLLRFAPQIAFVRARLSPEGYLGLRLTVGALVLVVAAWLFGGIAEDVVSGARITLVDALLSRWFHAHATPEVTRWMLVFTDLHGVAAISAYVVLTALFLAWRRDWYWLLCVLLTVPSGMAVNALTKLAFHRARPSFEDSIVILSTFSFPSGHVAGATLFYGVLAAMLWATMRKWSWRLLVLFIAFALVSLVALTRTYLAVHYLSDVLAAFAESVAWLALCLTGIHTFWQQRQRRKISTR